MDVYLNGRMVSYEKAWISVGDAGFQHSVGLFETMAAYHSKPFRLEAHLNRLASSAAVLGLIRSLDLQELAQAVQRTLKHNYFTEARIRLTLTAGEISLLERQDPKRPTVLVVATQPTRYDPAYFERGITVMVGPAAASPFDPLAGHKTLAYWSRLRTVRQAAAVNAGEVIWLNVTNHLASGAVSNLFLVKDSQLFTPFARGEEVDGALPAPVLRGITREAVIEIAESLHLPIQRRMLGVSDLLEADEVFLTNSSWHLLPVSHVEKQPIGTGRAGPISTRLRQALLELIQTETRGSA